MIEKGATVYERKLFTRGMKDLPPKMKVLEVKEAWLNKSSNVVSVKTSRNEMEFFYSPELVESTEANLLFKRMRVYH